MGCDSGVELDVVAGTHTPASRQWATHGSEVRPTVAFAFVRPSFVHFAYAHTPVGSRRVRLGLGRVTSSGAHKGRQPLADDFFRYTLSSGARRARTRSVRRIHGGVARFLRTNAISLTA